MSDILKFKRTGNETAILGVFVFACCVVGAVLGAIIGDGMDWRIVGMGCIFLVLSLSAQKLKDKRSVNQN